jgi:hypothetical protein
MFLYTLYKIVIGVFAFLDPDTEGGQSAPKKVRSLNSNADPDPQHWN